MHLDKIPHVLENALASGAWRDPGPKGLAAALGLADEEVDLALFETREEMDSVALALDEEGYVRDAEFCMVLERKDRLDPEDGRLVFRDAIFLAGSRLPGDDVFVAVDVSRPEPEQMVLLFDWSRSPPDRWVPVVSLLSFVGTILGHSERDARG